LGGQQLRQRKNDKSGDEAEGGVGKAHKPDWRGATGEWHLGSLGQE
jgi:hypothetical protein